MSEEDSVGESGEQEELEHVQWMLLNMPSKERNPGKHNRWLGFIQGWLWSNGYRSVDEMRSDVREGEGLETCREAVKEIGVPD